MCFANLLLIGILVSIIVKLYLNKPTSSKTKYVWVKLNSGEVQKFSVIDTPYGPTGYIWKHINEGSFVCLPDGSCDSKYAKSWKWDKGSEPNGSANKAG